MSCQISINSYGNDLSKCHLISSLILLNHPLTGNPIGASMQPHPVQDDMSSHQQSYYFRGICCIFYYNAHLWLLCHKRGGAILCLSLSVSIAETQYYVNQGFQASIGLSIDTQYQTNGLLVRQTVLRQEQRETKSHGVNPTKTCLLPCYISAIKLAHQVFI